MAACVDSEQGERFSRTALHSRTVRPVRPRLALNPGRHTPLRRTDRATGRAEMTVRRYTVGDVRPLIEQAYVIACCAVEHCEEADNVLTFTGTSLRTNRSVPTLTVHVDGGQIVVTEPSGEQRHVCEEFPGLLPLLVAGAVSELLVPANEAYEA